MAIFVVICCSDVALAGWKFEREMGVNNHWGVGGDSKSVNHSSSENVFIKKALCVVLAVILVIFCASFAAAGWKFEDKITIVCPWAAGSASDETIRTMAKLLNVSLNQEVEVVNIPGRDGCDAIEYAYKRPANGYTFLLGTQSLFMQDIQANTDIRFKDEFVPVARLVHAINVLTLSKRSSVETKCTTFTELSEYVLKNPFEISVGMLTSTGLDGVALRQTVECLDVLKVAYHTTSDIGAALVEGHIDLMIGGISEVEDIVQDGEALPILSLSRKRLKHYPDVQCAGEIGLDSFLGPARGIFARAETPHEAVEALSDAIKKVSRDPVWAKFLADNSYDDRPGFADYKLYQKACDEDYKLLSEYINNEGLLKRDYVGITKTA